MNGLEQCAGCGILARVDRGGHPIVGVMNTADAAVLGYDTSRASERGFVDVPVCSPCHVDPGHRIHPLKCHFFPRAAAADAVRLAGSASIGGPLTRTA